MNNINIPFFESKNEKNSSLSPYKEVFPFSSLSEKDKLDEEKSNENINIYFNETHLEDVNKIKDTKASSNNDILPIPPKIETKKKLFKTTKEEEDKNFLGKKKKLKDEEKNQSPAKEKSSRKYDIDLMLSKNQNSCFNSCFGYSNDLLKYYGIEEKFILPNYITKKFTNYENFLSLNQTKIGDILRMKRSDKKQNFDIDINHNEKLYNKVTEKFPVIKNFFEQNYITFFRKYYFKGERNISLKEYGCNGILTLNDCVITHPNKVQSFEDKNYAKTYDNYIRDLFVSNTIYFRVGKK